MTNNNNILTVSYGTFSCTLEGFEDSFGTMKAIAEYFRDLSAEDRYFGSEPVQPDAERLAQIAEREVSRRVEAREHDGQIMLKAHNNASADTTEFSPALTQAWESAVPFAAPASTPVSLPEPAPSEEAAPSDYDPSADDQVGAVEETPPEASDENPVTIERSIQDDPEALAEDDQEQACDMVGDDGPTLQDVASDRDPHEEVPAQIEAPEAEPQFAHSPTVQDDFAEEMETQDAALDATASLADDTLPEDVEEEVEIGANTLDNVTPFVDAPATGLSVDANSISAKLQRIRDVVADDDEAPTEESQNDTADLAEFVETEALDASIAIEEPAPETEQATVNSDLKGAIDGINQALRADAPNSDAPDEHHEHHEHDSANELSNLLKRLEAGSQSDDGIEEREDAHPPTPEVRPLVAKEPSNDAEEDKTEVLPLEAYEAHDGEETATAPVTGRVLKVDRAELEAAIETGELEEIYETEEPLLSAEEEAELQRDLAAIVGETSARAAQPTVMPRDGLAKMHKDAGQDVSRLMAEADHKMEDPEGATRRNAFAHLRAAVEARFADKTIEEEPSEADTTRAYRDDLAEVVKPRRPIANGNRTKRPAEAPAAPLQLVAEQRIDVAASGNTTVTPRRIANTFDDDLDASQDTGFIDFAAEMDATELPDVLEAAASYLTFVEGLEYFSRPQLMSRVRQVDCGPFTREDGLRCFGQLLRSGKIDKLKGGQFAASPEIGFQPAERAAG